MPHSALEVLSTMHISYPMTFKISNLEKQTFTHCGVLEFTADEGLIFIPRWMLQLLDASAGNILLIESVVLPLGTFVKFQPETQSFFTENSNSKAVLEMALRNYSCLTTGDVIEIRYNEMSYRLRVLDLGQQTAVSIVECDMELEFENAPDYVPPAPVEKKPKYCDRMILDKLIQALKSQQKPSIESFSGSGFKIKRKNKVVRIQDDQKNSLDGEYTTDFLLSLADSIPDYEYQPGFIYFDRRHLDVIDRKMNDQSKSEQDSSQEPTTETRFAGPGSRIGRKNRN